MDEKQLVGQFFIEQNFSISVAISNLGGSSDVQWTTCYSRTCKALEDEYDRKICKLECQWRSVNLLVSRMVGLRGDCRKSDNQDGCMKTLNDRMLAERMKQRKIREMISQVKRQKEAAKRNQPIPTTVQQGQQQETT